MDTAVSLAWCSAPGAAAPQCAPPAATPGGRGGGGGLPPRPPGGVLSGCGAVALGFVAHIAGGGHRGVAASRRSIAGRGGGVGCAREVPFPRPPLAPHIGCWRLPMSGAGVSGAVLEGQGPGGQGGERLTGQAEPPAWFSSPVCPGLATVAIHHRPGCTAPGRQPGSGVIAQGDFLSCTP